MSMDVLKNKIRKLRNPSALTIAPTLDMLPPSFLTDYETPVKGKGQLQKQLPKEKSEITQWAG